MTALQALWFFVIMTQFCTVIHLVMQFLRRARIPLTSTPAIQTLTGIFVWTRPMYPVAGMAMIGCMCLIDPNWFAAVSAIVVVLLVTRWSYRVKLVRVEKVES